MSFRSCPAASYRIYGIFAERLNHSRMGIAVDGNGAGQKIMAGFSECGECVSDMVCVVSDIVDDQIPLGSRGLLKIGFVVSISGDMRAAWQIRQLLIAAREQGDRMACLEKTRAVSFPKKVVPPRMSTFKVLLILIIPFNKFVAFHAQNLS